MIRVYIASPYTIGDVAVNVRAQLDAADLVIEMGAAPLAPLMSHFQHMAHPRPYETWMALDVEWLPLCHAVWRLPGQSAGADREVVMAKERGLPVFTDAVTLHRFIVEWRP